MNTLNTFGRPHSTLIPSRIARLGQENLNKKCNICQVRKPIDLFHRNKDGLFGRQGRCKDCHKTMQRELYRNSPKEQEYKKNYAKLWRAGTDGFPSFTEECNRGCVLEVHKHCSCLMPIQMNISNCDWCLRDMTRNANMSLK